VSRLRHLGGILLSVAVGRVHAIATLER